MPTRRLTSRRPRASAGRLLRLVRVARSGRAGKKWQAEFRDGTTTHFGATGYQDYTQHHDRDRRANYRPRHRNDLATRNPHRAGFRATARRCAPTLTHTAAASTFESMVYTCVPTTHYTYQTATPKFRSRTPL